MPVPELLRDLLAAHGPSGYEGAPAAAWRRHAEAFAEVESDVLGSSTARVAGTGGGPTVAVVGHVDEIGLIVTHVDDKGFLWFIGVGGWDPQVLIGQRGAVAGGGGGVAPAGADRQAGDGRAGGRRRRRRHRPKADPPPAQGGAREGPRAQ